MFEIIQLEEFMTDKYFGNFSLTLRCEVLVLFLIIAVSFYELTQRLWLTRASPCLNIFFINAVLDAQLREQTIASIARKAEKLTKINFLYKL